MKPIDIPIFHRATVTRFVLPAIAALATVILYPGCGTTSSERNVRSTSITASGNASIEHWTKKGLSTTRIRIHHIDGQFLQSVPAKGVFPLTPGSHDIDIYCEFSRMTVGDLIIDAGGTVLQFEAKPKIRYRVRGEKLSATTAELWIEDVALGTPATAKVNVPLTANPQNVQVFVPVVVP